MSFLAFMTNSFLLSEAVFALPMAYIDPNTGGMLFQLLAIILALFSGVIFFFSRQIKSFFARLRRKKRGEADPIEPALSEDVKEENVDSDKES